jgi:hypothetical protein
MVRMAGIFLPRRVVLLAGAPGAVLVLMGMLIAFGSCCSLQVWNSYNVPPFGCLFGVLGGEGVHLLK